MATDMKQSKPTRHSPQVFCNRTLNLRSIKAIGYDMDYTLVQYHANEWEERAYDYIKEKLLAAKWPVENFKFDPLLVNRGTIIDLETGNVIKTNRFGYVKRAMHGMHVLEHEEQRALYSRIIVDLAHKRWIFLNTLFSLSEGCMYMQLVDLLDQKKAPEVMGYGDLYRRVKSLLDSAHMEGRLKADILRHPERYIIRDAETPLTLLDQYHAGKKLLLITNSEWAYTDQVMAYTLDPYLPKGVRWKDLFEVIIVSARKPNYFVGDAPVHEVDLQSGLLSPLTTVIKKGGVYFGGSAAQLEKQLGISGDEILYVGDHMFGDVHVSKNVLRWRTALVLSELDDDIAALDTFAADQAKMSALMEQKEILEDRFSQIKVKIMRSKGAYGNNASEDVQQLQRESETVRQELLSVDAQIAPLAKAAGELNNPNWGPLMRAGNDKSYLAYQLERYADIYMSKVSNLLAATPFRYFRSKRGTLPHD